MIRKLTASPSQIKAVVAIGTNEWGGTVTAEVVLPRKAEEVQAAIAALEELCLTEAQTFVCSSRERQELDDLVRAGVQARLAKERERIERDAGAKFEARNRWLENDRDVAIRRAERLQERVNALERDRADARQRITELQQIEARQEGTK